MTQTFQLDSAIQIDKIFLPYQDGNAGQTVTLQIFEVDDVLASSVTEGTMLLDVTFSTSGISTIGTTKVMEIDLLGTDEVTLPARSAGSTGYGIQFDNTSGTGAFNWRGLELDTDGPESGSPLPGAGSWYDQLGIRNEDQDFAVAFVAVPEPGVAGAVAAGLALLASRRRRADVS